MPQNHNIQDWHRELSQEERTELARKAGKASADNRRKYKAFRDCLREILTLDVTDAAELGDIEAARFVRDTNGEKPTEALQLGITDKPIKSMDLSKLSDAELEALADRAED